MHKLTIHTCTNILRWSTLFIVWSTYNERFSKWSARKITCVCFNLRWFQYIICWRLKCFWLCNWRLYLLISACYLWSKSLGESRYDWSGINPWFSWLIIARVTQINIRIENLLRLRMNNLSDRNVRRRKQNNPNMHRFKGTELYIYHLKHKNVN